MSQKLSLERLVADWMDYEAAGGLPDPVVDQVLATTARMRPLPRWMAVLREPALMARTGVVVGMPRRRLALLVALVLLAVALATGAAAALLLRHDVPEINLSDDWPGFRGTADRTGVVADGPVGNPVVDWTFHASGGVAGSIAIAGGLVLAPSDDGVLHALAASNGMERWRFTGPPPMHGPFASNGRVYVADGAGVVHALTLADGKELWATGAPIAGPSDLTISGTRLFVGSADGSVIALDTASGSEFWRTSASDAGSPIHAPAVADGVLVIARDDGRLVAFDEATGATRWGVDTGLDQPGTPVVADGVAYIGGGPTSVDAHLVAYDLATGNRRWTLDQNLYSPAVMHGLGYSGSAVGLVTSMDLVTGSARWTTRFDGVVRPPAVAGDVVYVSADHERRIVGLDRLSGGELWSVDVDGVNACCIAVARGVVYVGTSAGTVYAISGDGARLTPKAAATNTAEPTNPPSPTPELRTLSTKLVWAVTSGAKDFFPWGLAEAPDGRFWVTEGLSDRFSIFETDGTYVESWGKSGTGDGEFDFLRATFHDPFGMVAFAPDGSFYVLDVGNRRVQQFDRRRRFVRAWGSFGSMPGQFIDPMSFVIDSDGNLDVLDNGRGVIETFSPAGKVVRTIPAFPAEIGPNDGANQVTVGPNGHYYLSVTFPNEVIELDRSGTLIATYGGPTSGQIFTEQPNVMAFDAAGRLYVTQGPSRGDRPGVIVFDVDGTLLGGFGPRGGGLDRLGFPWGLIVKDDGVVVADAGGIPEFGFTSLLRKFDPITFP